MSAAVISAALFSASSAFACCTVAEARQALQVGNFDLAASAAPQLGTTEARLIAAEALSAKVLLGMAEEDKDSICLSGWIYNARNIALLGLA